jgi:predicted ABC-type transport system involved in lysophospholipase L1 biosynthesis ATPase subunit
MDQAHPPRFEQGLRYLVTYSAARQKAALLAHLPPPPHTAHVTADGGLLSNLRVSENLLLPASYHSNRNTAELEQCAVGLLSDFGLDEAAIRTLAAKTPSHLSGLERLLVGFVRAVLMRPSVMVYDSLWGDLARNEIGMVLGFDDLFRVRFPAATSIYLHNERHARPEVSVDHAYLWDPDKDESS